MKSTGPLKTFHLISFYFSTASPPDRPASGVSRSRKTASNSLVSGSFHTLHFLEFNQTAHLFLIHFFSLFFLIVNLCVPALRGSGPTPRLSGSFTLTGYFTSELTELTVVFSCRQRKRTNVCDPTSWTYLLNSGYILLLIDSCRVKASL